MRRLLSIYVVFCLFNLNIHGAVDGLANHHSVTMPQEKTTLYSPVKTNTYVEKINTAYDTVRHGISMVIHHPITAPTICAISAVLLVCYGMMVFLTAYADDVPYAVAHTLAMGGSPSAFAVPETCANPWLFTNHVKAMTRYEHLTQGTLPLTEVIPLWLNEAQQLMAAIGAVALQLRNQNARIHPTWETFQEEASALLNAHGMPAIHPNIRCDVVLGADQNQVSNCQYLTPETRQSDARETLLIRKNTLQLESKKKLITRQLLQVMNPQTQANPGEIKRLMERSPELLDRVSEMVDQLQDQHCPSAEERAALLGLIKQTLNPSQIRMTGTVRCDMGSNNGTLQIIDCAPDERPRDTESPCFENVTPLPGAAALSISFWDDNKRKEDFKWVLSVQPAPAPTTEPALPTSPPTEIPTEPVKNTTTRLYWSNTDANEIWVAEINQTDGSAINPRVFINSTLLKKPTAFCFDWSNNIMYWNEPPNMYGGYLNYSLTSILQDKRTLSLSGYYSDGSASTLSGFTNVRGLAVNNGSFYYMDSSFSVAIIRPKAPFQIYGFKLRKVLKDAFGLTIDFVSNTVYFLDLTKNMFSSFILPLTYAYNLTANPVIGLNHTPKDLSFDIKSQMLYFLNRTGIYSLNLKDSQETLVVQNFTSENKGRLFIEQ